jgi:flagellar hook-length control protein FliK
MLAGMTAATGVALANPEWKGNAKMVGEDAALGKPEGAGQQPLLSAGEARAAQRGQAPSLPTFSNDTVVFHAGTPPAVAAQPQPQPQPSASLNLNARFASPVAPGRPTETAPPTKETPKTSASSRPAERSESLANESSSAGEPLSGKGLQALQDPAPALSRSESLGLQPTQIQGATSPGSAASGFEAKAQVALPQVPAPPQLQQVESGIRWMLRNASSGAELQLHPEALGRVRIELRVEGGEVHARLWASDPKSIPVLQENKAFLEVSLKDQGLSLGSFDLRQQSNQPQGQGPDGQPRGQFWPTDAPGREVRQDAPTRLAATRTNAGRIELIA